MNSIIVSALGVLDALLCVLVALAACDYLRRIRPMDSPLLAVAFYLAAIGAFGSFVLAMSGHVPTLYGVILKLGIVLYAVARRGHVFQPG